MALASRFACGAVDAEDAAQLYTAALGGIAGADIGRQQANHQMLVDAIAFFAIASILGIPRCEAEEYLPE